MGELHGNGATLHGVDARSRRVVFAFGSVGAAAALGGIGARTAPEVYEHLERPPWAPPSRAFGPVWSGLYAAIGIAGWRLSGRHLDRRVIGLHLVQLALNGAWPWAYFGLRSRRASLGTIVALDLVLAGEIVAARRTDPVASALLSPYLAWCLFATALNVAVDPRAEAKD